MNKLCIWGFVLGLGLCVSGCLTQSSSPPTATEAATPAVQSADPLPGDTTSTPGIDTAGDPAATSTPEGAATGTPAVPINLDPTVGTPKPEEPKP